MSNVENQIAISLYKEHLKALFAQCSNHLSFESIQKIQNDIERKLQLEIEKTSKLLNELEALQKDLSEISERFLEEKEGL